MCCDSPTVISSTEPSQSEKESHDVVKGSGDEDVPFSEFVQSVSCDPIRTNTTKNDGGFTFEVSSLVDLSERATEKGWKPFPSSQAFESSLVFLFPLLDRCTSFGYSDCQHLNSMVDFCFLLVN